MGTANVAEVDIEHETSAWMRAHHALSRLAQERASADAEEGRWLLEAVRSATHLHLGFASFSEYVERSFGYKPRSTQEKLRVAEALEELPVLSQALERGTLHWSTVRELTRVATPDNERAWLALANGKTLRQLEDLVAGRAPGDDPDSPYRAAERRHILRFEVAPETFAIFREAMTALRRGTDAAMDDDAALLVLARLALGGPRDQGRASYQIAVTVCSACGQGHQPANGELVPIGPDIVAMAHCDGQHLGCVELRIANQSALIDSPDLSSAAHVDAHAAKVAPDLNQDAHVGANTVNAPTAQTNIPIATRAKQTTPPALRRTVLTRDHHRCRVPGCRNATFLDVHHLHLRSEGGPNDAENLITLCGAHHRAAHYGKILIDGTATTSSFRHADGSPYGRIVEPQVLEARAKAFRALRGLGFREGDVQTALTQLEREGILDAGTAEQWLRAALARLMSRGRA